MFLEFFGGVLAVLFVIVYGYFWHRSRFFIRRGIPGPKPTSVFNGNLRELQVNRKPFNSAMLKWEKQYGKTFGYLEGGQKVVCTSDLGILHDVFGRKFENFHSRKPIHVFPFDPDTDERVNVFTSRGLRWKRLRALTSPSFGIPKLRNMQWTMLDTTKKVVELLEDLEGQEINMAKWLLESSTDVIDRIAFGKPECGVGKEQNPVTKIIRAFFDPAPFYENPIINFYSSTFEFQHWTIYFHKILLKFKGSPLTQLAAQLIQTIEEKREKQVKKQEKKKLAEKQFEEGETSALLKKDDEYEDFVDLFLNCEASDEDLKNIEKTQERYGLAKAKIEKRLSDQEIISMCSVLMLAGVDTTATAMSCLCYNLAVHPDAQRYLHAEIDDFIHSEADIHMDNVNNMKYLDWCIKESMRVLPFAAGANSRICMKTCEVGEQKLKMEAGMTIVANVWSIHLDKKLWGEDAEQFIPERWDPDADRLPKDPYAYQPFGLGPRQCMGMKFGLLEIKLMYCHLLKRFEICRNEKTKCDMAGIIVCGPHDVYVTLKRRTPMTYTDKNELLL